MIKLDDHNTSIRTLIRDVNKKIEKDLNLKGSKGHRKSTEKSYGNSNKRYLGKINTIKGKFILIKFQKNKKGIKVMTRNMGILKILRMII